MPKHRREGLSLRREVVKRGETRDLGRGTKSARARGGGGARAQPPRPCRQGRDARSPKTRATAPRTDQTTANPTHAGHGHTNTERSPWGRRKLCSGRETENTSWAMHKQRGPVNKHRGCHRCHAGVRNVASGSEHFVGARLAVVAAPSAQGERNLVRSGLSQPGADLHEIFRRSCFGSRPVASLTPRNSPTSRRNRRTSAASQRSAAAWTSQPRATAIARPMRTRANRPSRCLLEPHTHTRVFAPLRGRRSPTARYRQRSRLRSCSILMGLRGALATGRLDTGHVGLAHCQVEPAARAPASQPHVLPARPNALRGESTCCRDLMDNGSPSRTHGGPPTRASQGHNCRRHGTPTMAHRL